MVVLCAIVAAVLAACGLGLIGVGIGLAAQGEIGGLLFGAVCGGLTMYGAYLFSRAAVRIRGQLHAKPLTPAEATSRRSKTRKVLVYAAVVAVSDLALPVPAGVKVITAISAFLIVPLLLVVELEPPRRRTPRTKPTNHGPAFRNDA